MSGLINNIYQKIIIKNPLLIISFLILILGFFSFHAKNFELDASADSLILEEDKDLKTFREITKRYDTKDFVIITYEPNEDLFSTNTFKNIKSKLNTNTYYIIKNMDEIVVTK